jgi:type VI secretion system protein VasJ
MDLLQLGKQPVPGEQPEGIDVKYDPAFETLQAEIDKVAVSGAGSVDWSKVVQLSSEVLEQKSKDMLAASYLMVGLIYTKQIDGLITGLQIYADLIETFWEKLYPPIARMRGRVRAVEWWVEKAETALQQLKEPSLKEEELRKINENIEKIERFLSANAEDMPSLMPVISIIGSFPTASEEKPPAAVQQTAEPERKAAESAPKAMPGPAQPDILPEPASPADAQRNLNTLLQRMQEISTYLWLQDLSNPLPYRLSRIATWLTVDSLPPASAGKTLIPPPPDRLKEVFSDLRDKEDYESLLKAVEEKTSQFIFWMDLNFFTSEALGSLGRQYHAAQEAVNQETAAFIMRLPGIEKMSFSDGTPFAGQMTLHWLSGLVQSGSASDESASSIAEEAGIESEIKKAMEEAQALIKKGNLLEAVEKVQEKMRARFSKREQMLWRISLARLLMKNNKVDFSMPYLGQILEEIDEHRLDDYDPEVALKGLKLVWLGFNDMGGEYKEKAKEIFNRVGRIDLAEGIRLGKG